MAGWGRAALDDTATPSFLGWISETFKKFEFIQVIYITHSQGRAEFLPWSFWGENTKEKKENTEQSHVGLLHCPPTVIATSYALSLDPMHRRHLVVVSYASSLGLTRRRRMRTPRCVRIAAVVFESSPLCSPLSSPVLLVVPPVPLVSSPVLLLLVLPLLLLLLVTSLPCVALPLCLLVALPVFLPLVFPLHFILLVLPLLLFVSSFLHLAPGPRCLSPSSPSFPLFCGLFRFLIVVSSPLRHHVALIHLAPHHRCFGISFHPGGRVRGVSERVSRRIAKTNHDKCRGSYFVTHHRDLPLNWTPSSSSFPRSSVEQD